MVGNVALLAGFLDIEGLPGRCDLFPPVRVWWVGRSPWLPDAPFGGPAGRHARFYYAPIEDEL